MPPKLRSNDGNNVVIRPLAYCKEKDIVAYAEQQAYPIIPCDLCGQQPNLQRQLTKQMLQEWDEKYPGRVESIFTAIKNVKPSQLADANLFDFAGLRAGGDEAGVNAPNTESVNEKVLQWMPSVTGLESQVNSVDHH